MRLPRSERRASLACIAAALVLFVGLPAAAQSPDEAGEARAASGHPRTVLVLSGGGARGMAHIGVLEVLEELRVPVDAVIGTSMGAIVGGMYASGMSPDEMRAALERIDWADVFDDSPERKLLPIRRKEEDFLPLFGLEVGFNRQGFGLPSGLVAGQKLNFILRSMLLHAVRAQSFDDLPIPFRAVATDLATGKMVVIDHGDLSAAIRASMAFPVLFTPVDYEGQLLVDGGVVRNLAVDVALEMGAERIIAVDVGSTLGDLTTSTPNAFGILNRTQSVMSQQTRAEQLELLRPQDVLIVPPLDGVVSFIDFSLVEPAVQRGRQAAREKAAQLGELAVSESAFADYLARHREGSRARPITISSVEVRGAHRVDPRRILNRIRITAGSTLDVQTLQQDLEHVYLIGEFQLVEFRLEPDGTGTRFVIDVEEKSWGPWYVRGGIALSANFRAESSFLITGLLRRTELNKYGAEWRSILNIGEVDGGQTELYQPLHYRGTFFAAPSVLFRRTGAEIAIVDGVEYPIDSRLATGALDLGATVGNRTEIRVGGYRGRTRNDPRTPIPGMPDLDRTLGGLSFRVGYDRLDSVTFPRNGTFAILWARASRDSLGADDEYNRVALHSGHAHSFGPHTFMARLDLGTDLGSNLPFYDDFALGGFLNLSGLDRNQLRGSRLGFAAVSYYRRVNRDPGLFGSNYYIGASLEAGNVWLPDTEVVLSDVRAGGSLFLGADTLVGPLYLAYGKAEGQRGSWYLYLGRVF